ncbi:MAG TPA: divergent polysaccharide deacetylase family protein, partial [Reyranella sp.]|nr:divergent polysaccharide deacetylase family protein [Reyranella sp.]
MAMAPENRRRLPAFLHNGTVHAYALVIGLCLACAAIAYGTLRPEPIAATSATAASPTPPSPREAGTLSLPPPSQLKVDFRRLPAAEYDGMIEVTADGERLPRISSSGWMPWIAYARRFDPNGPPARVGLLMLNLGADEALTRRAIEELPPEVGLAFLAGTPDLPRWLKLAREWGHESYLMLPVDDPGGPAERGIRPIEGTADPAENLRRLRVAMARGEGYLGFVVPGHSVVSQSDLIARPLVKEIADRGLALIEINPARVSAMYRLTVELGVGYARSSTVLDYKLAQGSIDSNLERLVDWVSERPNDKPRHDFGVLQPDNAAI